MKKKDKIEDIYINVLALCAEKLGWQIAIPKTKGNENVPGLILGEQQYINRILENVPNDIRSWAISKKKKEKK